MEAQQRQNQVHGQQAPANATIPILGPLEEGRMDLTRQELQWALNLKAAIDADPEVDSISDFLCAQIALMVQDDVEEGVHRAHHLQIFRQEYSITDTFEQACQMIPAIIELLPGVALSLSYNRSDGNYVFVYDMGAFDFKKTLKTPENSQILLAGIFYICHALSPDLEAVRRGVIILTECSGFDWSRNMNLAFIRKLWSEILVEYPMDYQKMKYFNAGFFINMINSLKKRFLPQRIVDKMETGCVFEERLSSIYLVPTLQACNERITYRMLDNLARRYNHQREYRLPKQQPENRNNGE